MPQTATRLNDLRHFLLAVQFFTRIPITGRLAAWVGYSPAMLRASVAHFPAVGVLVGLWAGAVGAGAAWLLPSPSAALVVALLSTLAGVWLTGAFHEDGLADTADALGGQVERERALAIMKDSRIGTYGTVALVGALGLKVALLALLWRVLGTAAMVAALVLAHSTSRYWPLWVIRTLAHVGDTATSKSKPLADQVSGAALVVGTLWLMATWGVVVVLMAHMGGISALQMGAATGRALVVCVASALGAAWVWRLLKRRLQGYTGDGLGATQQISELAFWLALAAVVLR